jgi:hypothetical protein
MVMSVDGLHLCEECGGEFPHREMAGEFCRQCRAQLGDDDGE